MRKYNFVAFLLFSCQLSEYQYKSMYVYMHTSQCVYVRVIKHMRSSQERLIFSRLVQKPPQFFEEYFQDVIKMHCCVLLESRFCVTKVAWVMGCAFCSDTSALCWVCAGMLGERGLG